MHHNIDFFIWKRHFDRDGFTPSLRIQLREILSPKLHLREPVRWGRAEIAEVPEKVRDLVDWELVFCSDNIKSFLKDLQKDSGWQNILPSLFDDVQILLYDSLDIMRRLGEADSENDRSSWDMPSISPHWQNRSHHEWVLLIELLRDSWLALGQVNAKRAQVLAENWFIIPFPTFKRLGFFAASVSNFVSPDIWLPCLLADEGWWLWSGQTKREVMRLLVTRSSTLSDSDFASLEEGILSGPPRRMFRSDLSAEDWSYIVDSSSWLRLAKLSSNGVGLSERATRRYAQLSDAHNEWKLSADDQEEFSYWMSGTGDPGFRSWRQFDKAPRIRKKLIEWLRSEKADPIRLEDDWSDFCKLQFRLPAYALCVLAKDNFWPIDRWRDALYAWSDEKFANSSWRWLAYVVDRMPDHVLAKLANAMTWWLSNVAKFLEKDRETFLNLCVKSLLLKYENEIDEGGAINLAINHPIGHTTYALINLWFRDDPNDGEGLPSDIKPVFTMLCDVGVTVYRHARVIMAAHLISLFRVDQQWTTINFLNFFNWKQTRDEANAAWLGYLWSARLYRPLIAAIKTDFLATASHYTDLGDYGRQYAALLTYAALDPADTFTIAELREAIAALPEDALVECGRTLVNALEGAGEQREEQWQNRIEPFWTKIWPKSQTLASEGLAETLAHLAIAAGKAFPSVLRKINAWLKPLDYLDYILRLLVGSELCARFPLDSLNFLGTIVVDQAWAPAELEVCLETIRKNQSGIENDPSYKRLEEFCRRKALQ